MSQYHSIFSPSNGYWQCGQWVGIMDNATKYASEDECRAVQHFRNLPDDCEIRRNTTPWRKVAKVPAQVAA